MASVVARTDIACMATRNIIAPARAAGEPRWIARDAAAGAGADASRESAKLRSQAELRSHHSWVRAISWVRAVAARRSSHRTLRHWQRWLPKRCRPGWTAPTGRK